MDNSLLARLSSLSKEERHLFYTRLTDVLNDKYSCFIYGGINRIEYATMPKNKLERLKLNLYNSMFGEIIPPMKILVENSSPNERLEKRNMIRYLLNKDRTSLPKEKCVCSLALKN